MTSCYTPSIRVSDDKLLLSSILYLFFLNIDEFTANYNWQLINLSEMISTNKTKEWYVMCKRRYNPRNINSDLLKKCLKYYNGSKCYSSTKITKYCCAVDENGEIWFGCPQEIINKQYEDDTDCIWSCGSDGLFLQEYPICRGQTACEYVLNRIKYSAPAGRHATSFCPNKLSGYSYWYCHHNKTFIGSPKTVCCETDKICKAADSYLNVWTSCPSRLAQKRVTCPKGSIFKNAIAEWYCTPELKFKGNPDYNNCNKGGKPCEKKDNHGRLWKIPGGSLGQKICPKKLKGTCHWSCNVFGKFETLFPDCSKCQADWMDKVSDKVNIKKKNLFVPDIVYDVVNLFYNFR